MGGKAFGPAERIAQPLYLILQAYLLPRLESTGLFDGFRVPRAVCAKIEHGDLDVLCGWTVGQAPGQEEWVVEPPLLTTSVEANDHDVTGLIPPVEGNGSRGHVQVISAGKSRTDPAIIARHREMCAAVMIATGATEWKRFGCVVSFKLPVGVIGAEGDGFYQLDLALYPPVTLDFAHFITSYSQTALILGRMAHHLSRSSCIHMTDLSVRHKAFVGLPPIEVELTDDPRSFCEWFGLDWVQWEERVFETEQEVWNWLVNVPRDEEASAVFRNGAQGAAKETDDGAEVNRIKHEEPGTVHSRPHSLAARALDRMAGKVLRTRKKTPAIPVSRDNKRAAAADQFYDWLRLESGWAGGARAETEADTEAIVPKKEGPGGVISPGSTSNVQAKPDLVNDQAGNESGNNKESQLHSDSSKSTSTGIALLGSTETSEPTSTVDTATPADLKPKPSFVDPNQPLPLDSCAQSALEYFGKATEYASQLEERRGMAREIADRQREKERRRQEGYEYSYEGGRWREAEVVEKENAVSDGVQDLSLQKGE